MPWTYVDDGNTAMMRWQTRLTAAQPDAGFQTLMRVHTPMLQVEGTFGSGAVELLGSNSGEQSVSLDMLRFADIVSVSPVYLLGARLVDADETTNLLLTLVGRR